MTTRFLFLIYLFIVSDTVASAIAAHYLWRRRGRNGISQRFIDRLTGVLFGICAFNVFNFVANLVPPQGYTPWFATWYWAGRAVQSAMIWWFCKFLSDLGGDDRD